jgi:magnesium chelatase family protein
LVRLARIAGSLAERRRSGLSLRLRCAPQTLAHRGILFLDEALHFRADALDALRQPLEAGTVTIARVEGALSLPARFMPLISRLPAGPFRARG